MAKETMKKTGSHRKTSSSKRSSSAKGASPSSGKKGSSRKRAAKKKRRFLIFGLEILLLVVLVAGFFVVRLLDRIQ